MFLTTSNRDFFHDLILVQWDIGDDVWNTRFLLIPPSRGLGVAVISNVRTVDTNGYHYRVCMCVYSRPVHKECWQGTVEDESDDQAMTQ